MELLKRLIIHIIREVRDAGGSLNKTKLMKLLYLIDVEAYRSFRRTITGAQWFFFLYGPYATEVDNALNTLAGYRVQETQFLSNLGRRGFSYQTDEEPHLHEVLPIDERLTVQSVLQRWADEELNKILDFVYFNTPPMAQAQFRKPLDFSAIADEPTYAPTTVTPIPRELMARLRTRYRAVVAQHRTAQAQIQITPPRFDEVYLKSLKTMDEEETQDIGPLKGLSVSIAPATKDSLGEQS